MLYSSSLPLFTLPLTVSSNQAVITGSLSCLSASLTSTVGLLWFGLIGFHNLGVCSSDEVGTHERVSAGTRCLSIVECEPA
ncbi:hypothetical protein VTL71DRAFT_16231 [Oculimacula yallundae]|uniref:Uncharacterized protein n=1 Tax=Oculimacula yallundae TaxID=86028 RepID=A0ABR4CDW7_9HELO